MTRSTSLAASIAFARLDAWEAELCRRCNRIGALPPLRRYFSVVSRLGDGLAWYVLLALLPATCGLDALPGALHMGITALAGVGIYKLIKGALGRERPFAAIRAVEALLPPLDRYSFPSGHTLHATAFSLMIAHYHPALLPIVLPFALSVAASRVILGLHYPTDVIAGALVGALLARASLLLAPLGA